MDSLHCEVQYVNVFSVWCSNFSSRGGLLEKKMNEQERDRGRENKRMRNELRWVRHLHSLPVFFRREGEEKRRGGCSVEGGLKKTSARWRPFWRLQRSCTLGKGWGALNGTEEHTDKTWEGRRHALQCHRAPCLVQRASQKNRKRKRVKDRMEMMDLLGSIAVAAVRGGGLVYMLVKRPPCFLSYSFENKLHRQAQSNCIWVWSGFCLGLPKKKKTLKKRTTDSPCVAPCYKSGQKAVKNNKENRWERKWVWTGDTRVMMSYQCCSDVNNPVIVDELKSTRSRTSRHLFLCKLTATVQIHFKAVLLMFNWLFIQYLAFELYQSKWIVLVS